MRLQIEHRTAYRFSMPQARIIQLLRVTPPSFVGQSVIDWHLEVDCDARLRTGRDGYGNETTMLYIDGPVAAMTLTVGGEVLTEDRAGMVAGTPEPLAPALFLRSTVQTAPDAAITAFAHDVTAGEDMPLARLHALNEALQERIRFDTANANPHRDAASTFAEGQGVCQDIAHVFLAAARVLGHPARYVSGHLWRGEGASVQNAAHAWAEVWLDEYGWIGFDPTNGQCPTDAYIRVAAGLDYHDAAPVSGARTGGGDEALFVEVAVAQAAGQSQG